MDIKKIFNKKKSKSRQGSHTDAQGLEQTSTKSVTSGNTSTNSSIKSTSEQTPINQSPNLQTSAKSFQYSYNSNTNSLFSSKRTVSTGASSQPSSNVSYGKNHSEQAKITTIGRPLRVLHEDEKEEDETEDASIPKDDNIITEEDPSSEIFFNKPQKFRKKSNFSDDVSICPTEKSTSTSQPGYSPSGGTSDTFSMNYGPNKNRSLSSSADNNELRAQLNEFIKSQLRSLSNSIGNILFKLSQSVLNLTKASMNISENIASTIKIIKNNKYINLLPSNQFNTVNSIGLRRIIKSILHLFDNLLIGDVYNKSKASVIKNLHDLLVTIKLIPNQAQELIDFVTYMAPTIFPIDQNVANFPNVEKVDHIMTNLMNKGNASLFSDQDGSFIAPVLRGFCIPSLTIITFIFGFPEISKEHHDVIIFFSAQSNDIHYLLQKNRIKCAAGDNVNRGIKLKSPFRTIDENQMYVPISMSLSTDTSLMSSGTLGGYLYPKVPEACSNPKLMKYRGQIFGLTCAHVVLGNEAESQVEEQHSSPKRHPNVSTPSPVLINLYKNALLNEMMNHSTTSPEYKAYNEAVQMIDSEYPVKKIVINGKKVNRNLPSEALGNIIWGERLINDNRLSDLAIIKINDQLKKKFVNYLGEDLQLSQYDPALILSNLNVKKTVSLQPRKNGILNTSNLNIFKVGSTTGYTKGRLNGMKMIYWSDGSLRSSEFIVSSGKDGNMEGFANGGDSGAWILSKLSDVNHIKSYVEDSEDDNDGCKEEDENKSSLSAFIESFIPGSGIGSKRKDNNRTDKKKTTRKEDKEESGLGLLGMLHSYDGNYKQFGLFTPIDDILDRLEMVTGVEWGVVGCTEDGDTSGSNSRSSSMSSSNLEKGGDSEDD